MRVKKKYRSENGTRERLWVSKPHSKAESSSRLKVICSETKRLTNFKRATKNKETNMLEKTKNKTKEAETKI
jgi:hypothetical protein